MALMKPAIQTDSAFSTEIPLMSKPESNRREFLQTAAAGAALGALVVPHVHADSSDVIKVGVIGCGGRGSGAAENCIDSAPNVKIVALGDAFEDRAKALRGRLIKARPKNVDIPEDKAFAGLDAYEKVIGSGVDLVILATPPGFRAQHIQAAVAAGKHIFTEKPVAVDGPGARKCLDAYEQANQKKLCIVAGTQRRHQLGYLETLRQIRDGALGDITGGRCYWNQGPIWVHKRQDNWSDLTYQMRNWYYFVWLCGDHICEQHVHNLDVINWALNAPPVKVMGVGGRQARTGPEFGHIYDHFCLDYEYPNGVHIMSMCRQIPGTPGNVSEALVGTKGWCQANAYTIRDPKGAQVWKYAGQHNEPYVQEHTDLINAIRSGKQLNELKTVTESSLTAVMGRMAAYTGQIVSWEAALNSRDDTFPKNLAWDMTLPTPPVAVPGQTKLI
jgi:myo-inositol 2-dehydrogenase/D-chiro-inositol 1-dehydrogenase